MRYRFILSLLSILPLVGCTQKGFVLDDKVFCFDTMVETKLYEGNNENLKEINNLLSLYDKYADIFYPRDINNLYTINHTNEDVQIDHQLYELLRTSIDVTNNGAAFFNPLCGSLSLNWKESLKNGQILSESIIDEELLKMNNTSLNFKENDIVQRSGEATLDLGGIVKGYVLDEIYDYLNNLGLKKYLINAGSSSILLGEKDNKDGYFSVGLKDINNAYLKLKNCFVSTSGIKEQGVKIGDITYSHIINPISGSAINENDAVIVISDKGYYGDAMSTSLMMNTVEEIKVIETTYDIKTIVIKDSKIIYSNKDIEVYYH